MDDDDDDVVTLQLNNRNLILLLARKGRNVPVSCLTSRLTGSEALPSTIFGGIIKSLRKSASVSFWFTLSLQLFTADRPLPVFPCDGPHRFKIQSYYSNDPRLLLIVSLPPPLCPSLLLPSLLHPASPKLKGFFQEAGRAVGSSTGMSGGETILFVHF